MSEKPKEREQKRVMIREIGDRINEAWLDYKSNKQANEEQYEEILAVAQKYHNPNLKHQIFSAFSFVPAKIGEDLEMMKMWCLASNHEIPLQKTENENVDVDAMIAILQEKNIEIPMKTNIVESVDYEMIKTLMKREGAEIPTKIVKKAFLKDNPKAQKMLEMQTDD